MTTFWSTFWYWSDRLRTRFVVFLHDLAVIRKRFCSPILCTVLTETNNKTAVLSSDSINHSNIPVPHLPCPATAAYYWVSFLVGALSLTGPIVVLVYLRLSWQVGSLLNCSSSTSLRILAFGLKSLSKTRVHCGLWIIPPPHVNCCDMSLIQLNSGDCVSWYSSSWLQPGWLSPVRYGCLLSGRGYCDLVWALPHPQEGNKGDAFQPRGRQRCWWVSEWLQNSKFAEG